MAAGYTVRLTADSALTGATAKTILNVINAANSLIRITGCSVSFDGISATAEPVTVELCSSTQATAGTPGSSPTPTQVQRFHANRAGNGRRRLLGRADSPHRHPYLARASPERDHRSVPLRTGAGAGHNRRWPLLALHSAGSCQRAGLDRVRGRLMGSVGAASRQGAVPRIAGSARHLRALLVHDPQQPLPACVAWN